MMMLPKWRVASSNFTARQNFLNEIYDGFFRKIDNAYAKDKGIFYTKQEVVKFMIRMSDSLFQKAFWN